MANLGLTTHHPPPAASPSDGPRYRILAVCERTGVAAATLRAWERRYGIPAPARTAARYRLYDDDDIALIRRMAALCASGVRPAEAARLARQTPGGARHEDPAELVERLLDATVRMDALALQRVLDAAFAQRTPTQAYEELMGPSLVRIGERWADGALSIAHEHFAATMIRDRLLERLRATMPDPARESAVLACVDEEQHDLGLLGFALHVAEWGIRPVFLGARVPAEAIAAAVAQLHPRFVGLSMMTSVARPPARRLFEAYAAAIGGTPWLVGGRAVRPVAELARAAGARVALRPEDARALVLA
jgi:DNA-binding transcriptional MerR regulator